MWFQQPVEGFGPKRRPEVIHHTRRPIGENNTEDGRSSDGGGDVGQKVHHTVKRLASNILEQEVGDAHPQKQLDRDRQEGIPGRHP